MNTKLLLSALFGSLLGVFFLVSSPVHAQETETLLPLNVTVSPATLQMNTEPGKPVTATIRILNNNPQPETLRVRTSGFGADPTGEKPVLYEFVEGENPEKAWLTTSTSELQIEPFAWGTVEITFAPDDTAAFSYYYSVMFERTTVISDPTVNPVIGIPAVLVLTTVQAENMVREAELVDFKSNRSWYEFLPAEFSISVKNTGNVHVAPIGNVFIHQGNRKNIASLQVNTTRGFILPDSTRSFVTAWEQGFPAYRPELDQDGNVQKNADGTTKYKLKWDPGFSTQFFIGKFEANLVMIYDNGQRDIPLEKEIEFWVIPWKLLLIALVLAGLLLTGLFMPIMTLIRKIKLRKKIKKPLPK